MGTREEVCALLQVCLRGFQGGLRLIEAPSLATLRVGAACRYEKGGTPSRACPPFPSDVHDTSECPLHPADAFPADAP